MKNRSWIIIFSAVVVVCALAWIFISASISDTNTVGIYKDGKIIRKIDLNSVTADQEITLDGESGSNTILISKGHIKMKSAQCPDKLCVKHGELKSGGTPIVCLPNKIVIKFENDKSLTDAPSGAVK